MATLISASINLSKIDKEKIIKGKDGAQYYDITHIGERQQKRLRARRINLRKTN